jgi:hypothetical protein
VPKKLLSIEQILTILESSPLRLAVLSAGLSDEQLHIPPEPDARSARDILAHLRACSDMWGGTIKRLITEDRPTVIGVSPNTWIKKTDYLQQEFAPLLQAFSAQRAELLGLLEALPLEGWSRTGVMKAWGQLYPRVVLVEADALARHERTHLKQMERMVSTMAPVRSR